jgi:hypothetical protein
MKQENNMKPTILFIGMALMCAINPAQANACGHAMLTYAVAEHNLQQAMANPNSTPGDIASLQMLVARARAMVDVQCHAQ